jgi:hypothetical protein
VLWSDPDLARDRRFADSPLEEAVSSELVSGNGNFPGYWEKYRELRSDLDASARKGQADQSLTT